MLGDRREFSALRFACGLPPRWSSEKCIVQVTRAASNVVSAVNRLHVDRLSPAQGSLAHTDNLKNHLLPPVLYCTQRNTFCLGHVYVWCVCALYTY